MSAIKIGIALLFRGVIGVFPLQLFVLTMLVLCLRKKRDIFTYFAEFITIECIVSLTLLGIMNEPAISYKLQDICWIPFYSNWDSWKEALSGNLAYLTQILGNILMFVPFGFIFRQRNGKDLRKIMLVALLFPIAIEVLQFFSGRVADIDDVICNFIGVMLGYYLHAYISYIYHTDYGEKVEVRKINGIEISKCFHVGWIIVCLLLVVRLVMI